ncbi:MAG: hypothetical protein AAF561_05385 [Planctomycetota bacterium]
MSSDTLEVVEAYERLSPRRREEVLDFARFLLQREEAAAEEDGDAAWERIIADPRPRPKLDAFVEAALAEGDEPLDPEKL